MFAASILLLYVSRIRTPSQSPSVVKSIEMAVEILDAMDESIVAQKSAEIISQSLKEAMDASVDADSAPASNTIPASNSQIFNQDFPFEFSDYSLQDMVNLFDELSGSPRELGF